MPHQCLNCGEAFAEGSTDLLEGCPSCEGTRFFYTEEALEAEEREELREETEDDVETMLQDIVADEETPDLGEDIWSREAWQDWIRRKATGGDGDGPDVSFEQLAEAVEEQADTAEAEPPGIVDAEAEETDEPEPIQVELGDVEETTPPEEDPSEEIQGPAPDAPDALEPAAVPDDDGRPSTLNINDVGEYEIDVRRLLEDSPVIVERDGSYVIHLPSVFEREQ